MIESIQQHLEAPIPTWVFLAVVVVLFYRDYAIIKGLEVIAAILDKHSLTLYD